MDRTTLPKKTRLSDSYDISYNYIFEIFKMDSGADAFAIFAAQK